MRAVTVTIPGPPELLPGCPDAIVDLQTLEGAALVGGQWRYSDSQVHETGFVSVDPDLGPSRSEEHTSELQSRGHLVCRLLLEKKKKRDRQGPRRTLQHRRRF